MSEETSSENLNIPSAVFDAKCLYRAFTYIKFK